MLLASAKFGMSKRITIVLADSIHKDLEIWAETEGRATANLASFIVEQAVRVKYPKKYPPAHKRIEEGED